eukprot:6015773-Amphidinium_carterae.1
MIAQAFRHDMFFAHRQLSDIPIGHMSSLLVQSAGEVVGKGCPPLASATFHNPMCYSWCRALALFHCGCLTI